MVIITVNIMVFVLVTIIDGRLIYKTKKLVIIIVVVVVKYLSFIFGSHFAYSSIIIGFKLHNFFIIFFYSTFSFSYYTFSQKIIS